MIQWTLEFIWFGKLPTSTISDKEKFHYKLASKHASEALLFFR